MPKKGIKGFQKGNKDAKGGARPGSGRKGKDIREIHAAIFNEATARTAADKLAAMVKDGQIDAIKYTLDRCFGKAPQSVTLDQNAPLHVTVEYIDKPVTL